MTESTDPWAELERRAAEGTLHGITADTDDLVEGVELGEADINPNAKGGKSKPGQAGGMPPMMMGGPGGRGAAAAPGAAGGVGAGAPGVGADPSAMQAMNAANAARTPGAGMPAVGGTGTSGVGGAGIPGGAGPGVGGPGVMAAEAGPGDVDGDGIADTFVEGGIDLNGDGVADVGPGGAPLPGGPGSHGPGDVDGDGIADTFVEGGIDLDGDGVADVGPEGVPLPGGPGSGPLPLAPGPLFPGQAGPAAPSPGGAGSGPPHLGTDPLPPGHPGPVAGGSLPGVGTAPIPAPPGFPGVSGPAPVGLENHDYSGVNPTGGVTTSDRGPAPQVGSRPVSSQQYRPAETSRRPDSPGSSQYDGYVADPETLRRTASRWTSLSAEMNSVTAEASSLQSQFGLVPQVQPSYNGLSTAARTWSAGASSEFDNLTSKLAHAAGGYESAEAANAAQSEGINN